MENTIVESQNRNTAAIGCSIITTDKDRNKGLENKANGPKFSIEQGEESLAIALSTEKCSINEFGEIIRPDGTKTGARMSETERDRFNSYRKGINRRKQQLRKDEFTH